MADTLETKKRGSWTRIALFLSLALNILIIGLVVGAIASGGGQDKRRTGPPQAGQIGVGPLMDSLPSDVRRSMGRDMRRVFKQQGQGWRISESGRADLAALLSEPELDTAALEAELGARLELMSKVQAEASALLIGKISEMSLEEREAVAAQLLDWKPRRSKKNDQNRKP